MRLLSSSQPPKTAHGNEGPFAPERTFTDLSETLRDNPHIEPDDHNGTGMSRNCSSRGDTRMQPRALLGLDLLDDGERPAMNCGAD
jgi:hypothetical protein